MRSLLKVLFFSGVIFLAVFLPLLFSQAQVGWGGHPAKERDFAWLNKSYPNATNSGVDFKIPGGEKSDLIKESGVERNLNHRNERLFMVGGAPLPPTVRSSISQEAEKGMKTIIDDFLVNDDRWDQYSPALAKDPSGNFVITWQDYRGGWPSDIYAQRYDSSGNPIGSNFKVNDAGIFNQAYPAIAMDGSGDFVITWQGGPGAYPDIYAQRYDSTGTPLGSNFKVNDGSATTYYLYPAIAMDSSGNFAITWVDYRNATPPGWYPDIYAQRYNSSGNPLGSNFKVNDDTGKVEQFSPDIAVDGSGNFVITWTDERNGNRDIYAQRYNSSGTPVDSNFRVNDDAGTTYQGVPATAMDASGNFVITWMDYRNGSRSDIYAQRYDFSGNPLGSNFKVNDDVGDDYQMDPAIAMDGSGSFIITWQDDRTHAFDIYAQRYNSSGTPQGSNFKVNDDVGYTSQTCPAIAMDALGNFVITWEDGRNGNSDIYAQKYNFSGTPLGSNFEVNDDRGPTDQGCPAIALDGSFNFVITWVDYRSGSYPYNPDIYAQRYDSIGTPLGFNFKVNDATGTALLGFPAIAMDVFGNFVITWKDERNGDPDIYAQRYDFSGNPLGSNFKVNDDAGPCDQRYPVIAIDGSGNFVITWEDYRSYDHDIYAQRYNSSGGPLGSNFKVNDDAGTTEQEYPAIAMDGSGNFVITWEDERNGNKNIYAQRYDFPGNPLGSNFKVNDDAGSSFHWHPAIAIDGSGNFVITWEDWRNVGYNPDIYAQRYNSSGGPLGSNFKVNDDAGTTEQEYPATAMDDSGNFVITWQDYRNDSLGDIYAQRYNSSGNPVDSNFLVPNRNYASSPQIGPAVAANDSNIYFTWMDSRRGDWDIYAKVVDWTWMGIICGDANRDGAVNAADIVYLINYLFVGGPAPNPVRVADVYSDGIINSSDVVYLINYLFVGGPAPCS
jgi:hypothetical protein